MICWNCEEHLYWQGDNTYDECGIKGEGVVILLGCSSCEFFVLVHSPFKITKGETNDRSNV